MLNQSSIECPNWKKTCFYLLNVVKFDRSKVQKDHKLHCKVPGSLVCFSCWKWTHCFKPIKHKGEVTILY